MRCTSRSARPRRWITKAFIVCLLMACDSESSTEPVQLFGSVRVTVSTTGLSVGHAGYSVAVDGTTAAAVGPNSTVILHGLPVGPHSISLEQIAVNCGCVGEPVVHVDCESEKIVEAPFELECVPYAPGTIAIMSDRDGSWKIYLTDVLGSSVSLVDVPIAFEGPYSDQEGPVLSPDGSRIAIWHEDEIWVVNIDGTGLTQVVEEYVDGGPA